jgi:hypothetical protein
MKEDDMKAFAATVTFDTPAGAARAATALHSLAYQLKMFDGIRDEHEGVLLSETVFGEICGQTNLADEDGLWIDELWDALDAIIDPFSGIVHELGDSGCKSMFAPHPLHS